MTTPTTSVQPYLFFGGRCDEALAFYKKAIGADGGRVDMPLAKTFWSPRYGQVTDKFGLGWMVMVPAPL